MQKKKTLLKYKFSIALKKIFIVATNGKFTFDLRTQV